MQPIKPTINKDSYWAAELGSLETEAVSRFPTSLSSGFICLEWSTTVPWLLRSMEHSDIDSVLKNRKQSRIPVRKKASKLLEALRISAVML